MKTSKTYFVTIISIIAVMSASNLFGQQAYQIYFGNIHSHSSYSDGTKDSLLSKVKTPGQAYEYAKKTQHLDFLGISEHNHKQAGMKSKVNYGLGVKQAKKATEDGKFIALYGMEYGVIKNGGHVLIYGIDKLIGWENGNYDIFNPQFDYTALFSTIASKPKAFATLAHPDPEHFNRLKEKPYSLLADQAISGVAISTGQYDSKVTDYSTKRPLAFYSYYTMLLSKGYIVGPTIDHDNHNTTFGRHTGSRTAILAKSLTEDNLIEAYQANRFYATQDWNTKVIFTINGEPMGSYIKKATNLDIQATVNDEDPEDTIKSIELIYGIPGSSIPPKKLSIYTVANLTKQFKMDVGKAYYFFLKITQKDGDQIITSPIWAKN